MSVKVNKVVLNKKLFAHVLLLEVERCFFVFILNVYLLLELSL